MHLQVVGQSYGMGEMALVVCLVMRVARDLSAVLGQVDSVVSALLFIEIDIVHLLVPPKLVHGELCCLVCDVAEIDGRDIGEDVGGARMCLEDGCHSSVAVFAQHALDDPTRL